MMTTFGALAEPNRLRIIELLRDGPRSVNEIVAPLHRGQPLVSKHLRVLSQAGLVSAHAKAQRRIYQLEERPFDELDQWLTTIRRTWEARLDNLDDYLAELKQRRQSNPQE